MFTTPGMLQETMVGVAGFSRGGGGGGGGGRGRPATQQELRAALRVPPAFRPGVHSW